MRRLWFVLACLAVPLSLSAQVFAPYSNTAQLPAFVVSSVPPSMMRVLTATTTAASNAAQASTDLWTYALPASTFTRDGQVVSISAWGRFAANTNSKTVILVFGASGSPTIVSTTAITASTSLMWQFEASVLRASSTTLTSFGTSTVANGDGTNAPTVRPLMRAASLTDTQTSAITITLNAASGTNTAADMIMDGVTVSLRQP